MKKLFFAMALFLLVVPIVMAEETETECKTKEDLVSENINGRYLFLYYRAEIRNVEMKAIIELYEENGIDTADLEKIQEDFVALYDDAKAAAEAGDKDALDAAVESAKGLIDDFKEEAREANVTGVKDKLKAALEENADYLKGLKEDAVESKKGTFLNAFDARICRHQEILDKMSEKGYDVSELQSDLDAISAKRDDLAAKIDAAEEACDVPVATCTESEAEEVKSLKKEIGDDLVELNKKTKGSFSSEKFQKLIEALKTKIDEAQSRIDTMESKGIDVAELQDKLDTIKSLKDEAEEAINDGDTESAKTKLQEAKEKLAELKENLASTTQEAKTEGGIDVLTKAIEALNARIEAAQDKIDRLNNKGKDTSGLENSLDEARSLRDEAKDALNSGDSETAKTKLNEAKEKLAELTESFGTNESSESAAEPETDESETGETE